MSPSITRTSGNTINGWRPVQIDTTGLDLQAVNELCVELREFLRGYAQLEHLNLPTLCLTFYVEPIWLRTVRRRLADAGYALLEGAGPIDVV